VLSRHHIIVKRRQLAMQHFIGIKNKGMAIQILVTNHVHTMCKTRTNLRGKSKHKIHSVYNLLVAWWVIVYELSG
jgi:hypothetical protein